LKQQARKYFPSLLFLLGSDKMSGDTVNYEAGETPMTDYQFKCYKKQRDEKEAELTRELNSLRQSISGNNDVMTDYQVKLLMEIKDKCTAQEQELNVLRGSVSSSCSSGMTDYQFKRFEEIKDEVISLTREVDLLRKENANLKEENERLKNL